jgi:hypothetical protein
MVPSKCQLQRTITPQAGVYLYEARGSRQDTAERIGEFLKGRIFDDFLRNMHQLSDWC